MKISIAMTTYNGEKYILKQLKSILDQTVLPNEVIICDDKSTDNTVEIIKKFIKENKLNCWKLIQNKYNKGWQKNFFDTIQLTTGDIIFCSDQDDIWINDKIEIMSNIMKENNEMLYLSGKKINIDNTDNEIENLYKNQGSYTIAPINDVKKFNTVTLLGCTMCFKKEILNYLKDINLDTYSHDTQICRLAVLLGGGYILNKPVIKYRIHQNNTSGIVKGNYFGKSSLETRKRTTIDNIRWLDKILKIIQENKITLDIEKVRIIQNVKQMQNDRLNFYEQKKLIQYISLLKWIKYYNTISEWLGDFCYTYSINNIGGKIRWMMAKK